LSKCKRKTSKQTSDAELQAASGLAQLSRKKLKKAVKKISSSGIRRVPSAFDDDVFVGADSQKGFCFWPLFNFRDNCPSGSENEFVDIDSFSYAAPEVRKEAALAVAAETPVAAEVTAPVEAPAAAEAPVANVSLPTCSRDEASTEFTKELELTIQRGRILPNVLPWSKFGRLFPKIRLPLLLWPLSTRVLVRLCRCFRPATY
jgi:hypothetical protein